MLRTVYTNGYFLGGVLAALMLTPGLGVLVGITPLLALLALWVLQTTARMLGKAAEAVADSYTQGRGAYVRKQYLIHSVPDSRMADYQELERRFAKNIETIEKSKLDRRAKDILLREELKVYEDRLRKLML